ncbi:trehalose-6-phosphate synthase [Actinoallomurus oryzae]|uniref:Trehalose-6-phosphate synthase n=1 Tax=Actinoallomurus oryzae TaxID=502180 RepID=A0ABP8P808_9ACTN
MIVVSDRGPRALTADGRVVERNGSVTKLLARQLARVGEPATWMAPTTGELHRWPDRLDELSRCPGAPSARHVPIQVSPEAYHGYYLMAGARMLWMALHALETRAAGGPATERAVADYAGVNAAVADAVTASASPDEPVLVQDYQLALVPGMLRERGFTGPISFFLHTAFDAGSFTRLGSGLADDWLRSLCTADVLFFQDRRWRDGFQEAVRHRLGEGRAGPPPLPRLRVRPVTLGRADVAALRASRPAGEPPELAWDARRVNALFVGRLDPAKNVERCVVAFEDLLRGRPDLAGTVRLTLLLVPSRESLPEYAEYAGRVTGHCDRVRHRFPGSLHVVSGDDQGRALWAMTHADVVVANSVRDGGNLAVQEAVGLNERGCRLVISSGLGVAELLRNGAHVIADPCSVEETRSALGAAVDVAAGPDGRDAPESRLAAAREALDRCHPEAWLASQLESCREAVSCGSGHR